MKHDDENSTIRQELDGYKDRERSREAERGC